LWQQQGQYAIARAIGVRLTALPLTPERVWQALRVAQAHQTSPFTT